MLTLELKEHTPVRVPADHLPMELGKRIWTEFGDKIDVEFPSPKTDGQWELRARGWVGFIPLSPELSLTLQPKVSLLNLFRMLEYAYRLKSFHVIQGMTNTDSLSDFYERLAGMFTSRVLDRSRKGYYRSYVAESDDLPYVRERLDIQQLSRAPWRVALRCDYTDHTADIEDNQILAWTLATIARSGLCTERVLPNVRKAYRGLISRVQLQPFTGAQCVGRRYNRLNSDYETLHGLSRFFLDQVGPTHQAGDRRMVPFLVDMARLFELFVAEWLREHLPERYEVRVQEEVGIGYQSGVKFMVDIVIRDRLTNRVVCVLDTKYKDALVPETSDVAQVIAYAEVLGCADAVLVYPAKLEQSWDHRVNRVRVRMSGFSIGGDFEMGWKSLQSSLGLGGLHEA